MRWGVDVSAIEHTGQSEAIHSPDAWASIVVRLITPATASVDVVCTTAISCCRERPAYDLECYSTRVRNETSCSAARPPIG